MTEQAISKLKELKQLLDDGILTQEEFDNAKKEILNAPTDVAAVEKEPQRIAPMVQASAAEAQVPQPSYTEFSYVPKNTVPWHQRQAVMKATSAKDLADYYHRQQSTATIGMVAGGVLIALFVKTCLAGGFWPIFGAVFWALTPGCGLIGMERPALALYKRMEEKFKGVTDEELYYLKQYIAGQRVHERQVVGQAVKSSVQAAKKAAKLYEEMTGESAAVGLGRFIGSRMS